MIDTPSYSSNGYAHHQSGGRSVPELPEITFPGSGRKAQIRKVGEATKIALQKAVRKEMAEAGLPEPQVPNKTYYVIHDDPNSETLTEADPNDKDYQIARATWDSEYKNRASRKLYDYIIYECLVYRIDEQEVARLRKSWERAGLEVEGDDTEVYLKEILMPTEEDAIYLIACATQGTMPTEEDVSMMMRRFRGYV